MSSRALMQGAVHNEGRYDWGWMYAPDGVGEVWQGLRTGQCPFQGRPNRIAARISFLNLIAAYYFGSHRC